MYLDSFVVDQGVDGHGRSSVVGSVGLFSEFGPVANTISTILLVAAITCSPPRSSLDGEPRVGAHSDERDGSKVDSEFVALRESISRRLVDE